MKLINFIIIVIIFYSCKTIPVTEIKGNYIIKRIIYNKNWIDKESDYFFIDNIDSLTVSGINKYPIIFDNFVGVKNCCDFLSKNNDNNKNKLEQFFDGYDLFNIDKIFKRKNRLKLRLAQDDMEINYIIYKAKVTYCNCTSKYTYSELDLKNNQLFIYPFKINPQKFNKEEKRIIKQRIESIIGTQH